MTTDAVKAALWSLGASGMVYVRTRCPDWRLLSSVHLGHGDFLGQVQDATGPRWKDFGFLGYLVAQVPPQFSINTPHLLLCPWLFRDEACDAGQSSCRWHWLLANLCGHLPLLTHPSSTGRDPKKNREALEEFKKFTQKRGLVPDNLAILVQMGKNTHNPCSLLCPLCHL